MPHGFTMLEDDDEPRPPPEPLTDPEEYFAATVRLAETLVASDHRGDGFFRSEAISLEKIVGHQLLVQLADYERARPDEPLPSLIRVYDLEPRAAAIVRVLLVDRIRSDDESLGLSIELLAQLTGHQTPELLERCVHLLGPDSRLLADGVIVHLGAAKNRPIDVGIALSPDTFTRLLRPALDPNLYIGGPTGPRRRLASEGEDSSPSPRLRLIRDLPERPFILPPELQRRFDRAIEQVPLRARVANELGYRDLVGYGLGSVFLFCGAPGTGKTLGAHVVAQRLERPILEVRASNILRKFVGESEQAVMQAFAAAEQLGAVLLLDEVDSLLRSREGADRSYEVSLVNTLLRAIEDFDGVVILTSNHERTLDAALERRVNLRMNFPAPGPTERLVIWHALTDGRIEFAKDVDLPEIASREELTGAEIKNAVLDLATTIVAREDRTAAAEDLARSIREVRVSRDERRRGVGFTTT